MAHCHARALITCIDKEATDVDGTVWFVLCQHDHEPNYLKKSKYKCDCMYLSIYTELPTMDSSFTMCCTIFQYFWTNFHTKPIKFEHLRISSGIRHYQHQNESYPISNMHIDSNDTIRKFPTPFKLPDPLIILTSTRVKHSSSDECCSTHGMSDKVQSNSSRK